jgi:membrane-associated phospholipid phosphatase
MSSQGNGASRRTTAVLLGVLALYGVSLALLVALDQITMVWKSLVIPGVVIAAALTGRLRSFVRDWSVFLGAVILFDVCRGGVFSLIRAFEWPVYMEYAIRWDRLLFGEIPIYAFQQWMGAGAGLGGFDRLMGVAYASHFLAFILFGLSIWLLRPESFGRFKVAMIALMYGGLAIYALVPTVPPWMAAETFFVIPPISGVAGELFTAKLPALTAAFAINPVAAMPSLHCAFPTMLALFAFRDFGRIGWGMAAYASIVCASTVYLGQHYVVDVIAGVALAIAVFGVVHYWGALRERVDRISSRVAELPLTTHVLATGLLLALTQAVGSAAGALAEASPELPTPEFVERELVGKSPMAGYYARFRRSRRDSSPGISRPAAHSTSATGRACSVRPRRWVSCVRDSP